MATPGDAGPHELDPRHWVDHPRYYDEYTEVVDPLFASWDADRAVVWQASGKDIMELGAAYQPKGL